MKLFPGTESQIETCDSVSLLVRFCDVFGGADRKLAPMTISDVCGLSRRVLNAVMR